MAAFLTKQLVEPIFNTLSNSPSTLQWSEQAEQHYKMAASQAQNIF